MNLLNTTKIISMIKKSKSPKVITDTEAITEFVPHQYLKDLIHEKGLTEQQIILCLCLERSYAYRIFNGKRKPTRNILLHIAIQLGLSLNETQRLLRAFGRVELYPHIRFDAAMIYAIEHGYDLLKTDELLQQIGEPSLIKNAN